MHQINGWFDQNQKFFYFIGPEWRVDSRKLYNPHFLITEGSIGTSYQVALTTTTSDMERCYDELKCKKLFKKKDV